VLSLQILIRKTVNPMRPRLLLRPPLWAAAASSSIIDFRLLRVSVMWFVSSRRRGAQPRMARDIDLVVSLNETQTETFFRLFEKEYYLISKALLTPFPGAECLISFTMTQ